MLGRLLTAMVTPFAADGSVDYVQARRLASALVASGCDGVVVTGTTGEAPTLTPEEKIRLWREVRDELGDRATVVAGSGDNCTADSVALSREAAATGVDALLLTAPYYNKPTQEGLYRHFAAIAEAVDVPCIIYNIPGRTGVNISAETQCRLATIPNITGVKEASGDMKLVARVIEQAGPDYLVWSGNDEDTFAIMALGGYGVVSVVSHLAGERLASLVRAAAGGRMEEAAQVHRKLLPLIDALFCVTNPIPVKYALNQLGFPAGPFRLPLCDPDPASAERIMAEVRRQGVELVVSSS